MTRRQADPLARRQELGTFLRVRRERTSPFDVGLPARGRRRTPGLRREELAGLAGISTSWYTFLEQGRDVRASTQVLAALGSALRLDDAERAYLATLAGEAPTEVELGEHLPPAVASVPKRLEPDPAYITGLADDLLAWNAPAELLFRGLVVTDGQPPNLARWMFLEPVARDVLVDWQDVAQSVLARLRARIGRWPDSTRLRHVVAELRAASPDAATWWSHYDIATHHAGTKRLRDHTGHETKMGYASFQVTDRPEQVLTVYHAE